MRTSPLQILVTALLLTCIRSGGPSYAAERTSSCRIAITVPVDAAVYINDHATQTTGTERRFRSDGLLPGRVYTYRIRAEVQREGRLLKETQTVGLRAGQTEELVFKFADNSTPRKTLKPLTPPPARPSDVFDLDVELASLNASPDPPVVAEYLAEGRLTEGEEELMTRLRKTPKDNELRFSLGVVQFLQAVEGLMQSFYRHGLKYDAPMTPFGRASIPFLRLPVPQNPDPEPISYDEARRIMQTFVRDLWKAETTLAAMNEEEVRLTLDFGTMRLDSNGDCEATEDERLWKIFARVNPRMQISNNQTRSLVIAFDRADAYWLRGYCHLLMAMAEVVLAHDGRELFERSAFLFFPEPISPHTFLVNERKNNRTSQIFQIVDLVAAVHSIDLPVAEPERMASALTHLEVTIDESRKTWATILAEKDNHLEWIPGPNQTGVIPDMRVTNNIVQRWHQFLDELEDLLEGEKLIPFWRDGVEEQGVNLRRVFTEPTDLDLVGWVQGSAATPYLEHGELTDRSVWQRLQQAFGGQMMTFVVWFN